MSHILHLPASPHAKAIIQQRSQSTDADNTFFPNIPPSITSLLPNPLSVQNGATNVLTATISPPQSSITTLSASSDLPSVASVPPSFTIPANQTSGNLVVTGNSVGTAHILVTLNGNASATVNVSNPVSGIFTHEPPGMTNRLNWDFNTVLGPGMTGGGGSPGGIIVTDNTAIASPPNVYISTLLPLQKSGGSQLEFGTGTIYRKLFFGLIWRTNPQFQGRTAADKLFFLRGNDSNGFFGMLGGVTKNAGGQQLTPFIMFGPNSGNVDNSHVFGDGGFTAYPNVGSSNVPYGQWHKIEVVIQSSTTLTSRDGIIQIWVDGVQTHNYTTMNYGPSGLNDWVWTETWDACGGNPNCDLGTVNTVEWDHYIDKIYLSGA